MEKVGRSKHADLSISETFQNIGEIVYHMQNAYVLGLSLGLGPSIVSPVFFLVILLDRVS